MLLGMNAQHIAVFVQSNLISMAGHSRLCVNEDGSNSFSAHRRNNSCGHMINLASRQPIWPDGMLSVLAGFVEPANEVFEEVGLIVENVLSAFPPWPFPASPWLGFVQNIH